MTTRRIDDAAQYLAAQRMRMSDITVRIESLRTRRPSCARTHQPDELRALVRAQEARLRMLAAQGVLVQTGPHAWTVDLDRTESKHMDMVND